MPLAPVKNRARSNKTKQSRWATSLRNIIAGAFILALLIGGVYVLLLWLNKPIVAEPGPIDAVNEQNPSFTKPNKPPADVAIGSSIQSISSPIAPGDNASLTLRTTESAVCTIKIVRIDNEMREVARVTDSGLGDKTADDFGMVTWTWTMPADVAIAKWQADINCTRGTKGTRSLGEIVVERPKS